MRPERAPIYFHAQAQGRMTNPGKGDVDNHTPRASHPGAGSTKIASVRRPMRRKLAIRRRSSSPRRSRLVSSRHADDRACAQIHRASKPILSHVACEWFGSRVPDGSTTRCALAVRCLPARRERERKRPSNPWRSRGAVAEALPKIVFRVSLAAWYAPTARRKIGLTGGRRRSSVRGSTTPSEAV